MTGPGEAADFHFKDVMNGFVTITANREWSLTPWNVVAGLAEPRHSSLRSDHITRSLPSRLPAQGITVNAVAPGWIETASSTRYEIIAGRNTPVGRTGRPDEVAAAIAFLASESASYVARQLIIVDGGNAIQEYKGPPDLYY